MCFTNIQWKCSLTSTCQLLLFVLTLLLKQTAFSAQELSTPVAEKNTHKVAILHRSFTAEAPHNILIKSRSPHRVLADLLTQHLTSKVRKSSRSSESEARASAASVDIDIMPSTSCILIQIQISTSQENKVNFTEWKDIAWHNTERERERPSKSYSSCCAHY